MHYEKVGNNAPVCIEDELPFEIPDSWEWCRISSLGSIIRGSGIKRTETAKNGFPCVRYGELYTTYNTAFTEVVSFIPENLYNKCKQFNCGDVIFTLTGENKQDIAKTAAYLGKESIAAGGDLAYWTAHGMSPLFLSYLMASPYLISKKVTLATGDIIIHISGDKIGSILIPVPPLNEQQRIVNKLLRIEPFITEYTLKQQNCIDLDLSFVSALKKSILQEAVQGKLVLQDENDEPASVLLERIRAEKQALIKAGKIKKDKHQSIIFRRDNSHYELCNGVERCIDDEIPFEIPKNWEVIRLNDIGIYKKGPFGSSLTKAIFVAKSENTVKVYEQKNAIKKDHTLGSYYITRKYYEEKMKGFSVSPGDIIVSCAGTIGETYVLPDNIEDGIINQALMRMTIFAPIDINYFLLYFDYVLKQSTIKSSKGSAIKNIPPFEIFKKLLLPLPPIQEQRRIIEQTKKLFSFCDNI